MARRTKISGGFSTILSTIIMSLIMCLLVSFVYKRTDEFTTGFKSFYVEYGNTQFNTDYSHMTFKVGETYKFKVHSSTDEIFGNDRNYKVSVVANPSNDLTLYAVDNDYNYIEKKLSEVDLNLYFTFNFESDYFTISDTNGTLENYLMNFYSDYRFIDFEYSRVYSNEPNFRLVITSLKDVETINIDFNLTR